MTLVKKALLTFWREPQAPENLDSADAITAHRNLIEAKPLLKAVYASWYAHYQDALNSTKNLSPLPAIELGSGAGLVREFCPEVVRTDVVMHSAVDQVVTAERLPFADGTLRCILMNDVLHHLSDPAEFFREAARCLAVGGRVVMTDPNNSLLGRFVWGKLHPQERFDPTVTEWTSSPLGRLSDANMAIPWIIFVRDRKKFEAILPRLRVRKVLSHTGFAYLLTGGLTYRAMIPYALGRVLLWAELALLTLFPFLGPWFATMMTVELERVADKPPSNRPRIL